MEYSQKKDQRIEIEHIQNKHKAENKKPLLKEEELEHREEQLKRIVSSIGKEKSRVWAY